LRVAEEEKDEQLLRRIRGFHLFAREAQFHSSSRTSTYRCQQSGEPRAVKASYLPVCSGKINDVADVLREDILKGYQARDELQWLYHAVVD